MVVNTNGKYNYLNNIPLTVADMEDGKVFCEVFSKKSNRYNIVEFKKKDVVKILLKR